MKKELDLNNIDQYKFLVNSGCSYGVMGMVVSNPLFPHGYHLADNFKGKDTSGFEMIVHQQSNDVILIDVALQSQSVNWISDSIIYVVTKLLEKGVKPENIYCFIEWTEWDRISFGSSSLFDIKSTDFNFIKMGRDFNHLHGLSSIPSGLDGIEDFLDNLNIASVHQQLPIGYIDGELYITSNHIDISSIKDDNLRSKYQFYFDKCNQLQREMGSEALLKNFIDSILKTQWFLKSKGVKYNCTQLKSNFSSFEIHNGLVKHKISHDYINNINPYTNLVEPNPEYKAVNDPSSDLENIVPSLKSKIDMIDFSKWWFFENENYRRGGFDEWALSTFKECGYVEYNSKSFIDLTIGEHNVPKFNGHPSTMFYFLLWNEIATDCDFIKINPNFSKWFLDRFYEDYNSDEFTENGLVVSKKYLLEIEKKRCASD